MNNTRFIRITAKTMAVIMMLSIVMFSLAIIAPTADAKRVTQAQINELRDEKREYERQRSEIQAKINAIEFQRLAEVTKKTVLDERIMLTGLEIDNAIAIIDNYEILIREKEYEVALALAREDEQLEKYKNRVRDMEENGVITYLELIFDSTSFADMLARVDFIGDIMRADEKLYNDLTEARNETIALKEELELSKSEMEEERVFLELKEIELYEQVDEASALIFAMEQDIEQERYLRALVVEEEERVQKEINEKVEEFRKQEAANRAVRGTGELVWPANGRLTSGFGWRRHPVFGGRRHHNGIDIAAPHGANVFAADRGTVLISSYNRGFGNYIVVNHGNGMTTLYAHLSSRSVNVGTSVSRGQVIGRIGSTGVSTGPHLHFEVTVGGSRTNPLSRL